MATSKKRKPGKFDGPIGLSPKSGSSGNTITIDFDAIEAAMKAKKSVVFYDANAGKKPAKKK